ncbi:hypothetical protein F66182_13882, partial [Fusarium sp. NRRL 66182]
MARGSLLPSLSPTTKRATSSRTTIDFLSFNNHCLYHTATPFCERIILRAELSIYSTLLLEENDLEKMLPSIASINGIQVKDFITGLLNDSKIRMEKIGSNNWYWSFSSDEKRERENVQERLVRELNCLTKSVGQLEDELQKKQAAANEEDGTRDRMDIETERRTLKERKAELSAETEQLQAQKTALEDNGISKTKLRTEEIKKWTRETETWE